MKKKAEYLIMFVLMIIFASRISFAEEPNDWKQQTISTCKSEKEKIETNPDERLIYSCIAVSHFDNVMEKIGNAKESSKEIQELLEKAFKAKDDFDKGLCPDLVIGINKIRFKRFENANIEEFVVVIPDTWKPSVPTAVFIYPDNRRWGATNNYATRSGLIDVWWHTVLDKNISWKNFDAFIEIVKEKVNLDSDRFYVNGECGDGLAAISMALTRPDYWAECSASLGNTYRHLACNAYNLPLIFVRGGHQEDYLVGYYDFAVNCFNYYNCRFFKHSKPLSTIELRGSAIPDERRMQNPLRVIYGIEDLSMPSAYWCRIYGREDENYPATIDAIIWGQKIFVSTENIDAYTLELSKAPVDVNRPIEIRENQEDAILFTGKEFARKSDKYKDAKYIKNKNLSGLVSDVFTEEYAVVISSQDDNEIKICNDIAKSIAGSVMVISDANLTKETIEQKNIVVIGTIENNQFIQKIIDDLPIKFKDGKLTADNIEIADSNLGIMMIYPNPLNPLRYVAVFTATTQKALAEIAGTYSSIKNDIWTDIAVYEPMPDKSIKWHIKEKFDTTWQFQANRKEALAELKESYPKWKWQQLFARAIRDEISADAVIFENPFMDFESLRQDKITFRDLCSSINNSWIIKVSIKGTELKKIMMVPFNDISKRQVDAPIIDGVTFAKDPTLPDNDNIALAELENDKVYTVAMPERIINGKRMGEIMTDYKIEDFGWQQILIRDYLIENAKEIEIKLIDMKPNIF